MTDTKWTAGPWEVRFRFGRQTTVSGRQRFPICDTSTAPLGQSNERRNEANARLIAASPDLYEALEWLVALLPDPELDSDPVQAGYVTKARAALLRANPTREEGKDNG